MHCEYVNSNRMEERLLEAFDALWDDFVDPREAYTDVDGQWWTPVGASGSGATGSPRRSMKQQLRELRAQCRRLAIANEYAINGHENRISYIVGAGHSYRATICKGMEAEPELALAVQKVLDEFQPRTAGTSGSRRSSAARTATAKRFCGSLSTTRGSPRAIHRAGPGRHAGRAVDRSVGELRHPDRSGRRRDGARLLRRRRAGRRGRSAASPGERRSQREARAAALTRRCGRTCGGRRSCCGT